MEGGAHERPQTGTETSDENDGYNCCQLQAVETIDVAALTFHAGAGGV